MDAGGAAGAAGHGCAGPAPQNPQAPCEAGEPREGAGLGWTRGRSPRPRQALRREGPQGWAAPERAALPKKTELHVDRAGGVCSQMAAEPLLQWANQQFQL